MRLPALAIAFILASWTLGPSAAHGQGAGTYEGTTSTISLVAEIDISCILRTWRITGVFVCTHGLDVTVCLVTENAYPVGILEVVRRPWTSHLAEVAAFTQAMKGLEVFGETSSHSPSAQDGTGLQFTEAHVYEFVLPLRVAGLPLAVPSGRTFAVSYLSELDGFGWRTGLPDILLDPATAARKAVLPSCSVVPRLGDCVWSWGSAWPRTGFAVHPSEVMAGYLMAVRAGKVAAVPLGRVVTSPYPYEPRTGADLQGVRPAGRVCVSLCFHWSRPSEAGARSMEGAYLLVHFGLFRQCNGCFPATLVEPRPPGL